jgi:hypothetical protein
MTSGLLPHSPSNRRLPPRNAGRLRFRLSVAPLHESCNAGARVLQRDCKRQSRFGPVGSECQASIGRLAFMMYIV